MSRRFYLEIELFLAQYKSPEYNYSCLFRLFLLTQELFQIHRCPCPGRSQAYTTTESYQSSSQSGRTFTSKNHGRSCTNQQTSRCLYHHGFQAVLHRQGYGAFGGSGLFVDRFHGKIQILGLSRGSSSILCQYGVFIE